MGFFNNKLKPGHEALKLCPNCGEDKVGRRSGGSIFKIEYYCDQCGYEPKKAEVHKSFREMLGSAMENKEKEITDSELRKQVEDRKSEGWEIEEISHSGNRVVMSATKGGTIGGHALTGFLTGFWTLGAGNVVYNKLSKKRNKERIALRADEKTEASVQSREDIDPIEQIRDLEQLYEDGLITEEQFEEKKTELLDKV